jgi:hypothetical protein
MPRIMIAAMLSSPSEMLDPRAIGRLMSAGA